MTTGCDLKPGGDGSDVSEVELLTWWVAVCDAMGTPLTSDADLEASMRAEWAPQVEHATFGREAYKQRRREGSIARQQPVKLWHAWVTVEEWSTWYTGVSEQTIGSPDHG